MLDTMEYVINLIVFLIGALFGSFYTLAIYRIPLKKNIVKGRSFCPNCKNKLNLIDLFPIFSFVFLKGQCRYCKNKIKAKYFTIELLTAMIFVMFFNSLDYFKVESINELIIKNFEMFTFIMFYSYMFITAFIDKEKYKIEDGLLTFGVIISILYVLGTYLLHANVNYLYMLTSATVLILLYIVLVLLKNHKLRKKYYLKLAMFFVILSIYIPINTIIITTATLIPIYLILYLKQKKDLKKEKDSEEVEIKVEVEKDKEKIYLVENKLIIEESIAKGRVLKLKDLTLKNINKDIHISFALIIGLASFIIYIVLKII